MPESLPPKPSFRFLKLEAKSILKAQKNKDSACCDVLRHLHRFAEQSELQIFEAHIGLQEAQFALAMKYGFKNWTELKKYASKEETKMVKYENLSMPPYSTTLMSVIKGVADYYQIPLSEPMLYGLSGHAFVINIHKDICPSGPYVWNHDTFFHLVENLGITTDCLGFYDRNSTAESRAEVDKKLREAIDKKIPCSCCNMEHQLIKAYDSDGFLLLKPWPDCGTEEITPGRITFGSWEEFKEIHACFCIHGKAIPASEKLALIESLQYGVDLFTKPSELGKGDYGMGPEAYTKWIAAVPKFGSEHGNWWNAMVWSECRKMASEFFLEIAKKYQPVSDECSQLVNVYINISENLHLAGNRELGSREKIILLETAKEKELEAIEIIKTVLKVLTEPTAIGSL